MKKCPRCKQNASGCQVQPQGLWERGFLALLLFRPYRCTWCRRTFHRFGFRTRQPSTLDLTNGQKQPFFDFFPPEDGKAFPELLLEIREAERKMSAEENASDVTPGEAKKAHEETSGIWEVIDHIKKS